MGHAVQRQAMEPWRMRSLAFRSPVNRYILAKCLTRAAQANKKQPICVRGNLPGLVGPSLRRRVVPKPIKRRQRNGQSPSPL